MNRDPRALVIKVVAVLIGLGIAIFVISRLFPYIQGPRVKEINVQSIQYQDSYHISIEATVRHTEQVRINSIPTALAQDGSILHTLALNPGRNIIELELSDGFGKTRNYQYTIITPSSDKVYPSVYNQAIETLEEPDELTEVSDDDQEILTNE